MKNWWQGWERGLQNQKGKFLSVQPIIPLPIVQHSQPISSFQSCSQLHPPPPTSSSHPSLQKLNYTVSVREQFELSGEAEILLNAQRHILQALGAIIILQQALGPTSRQPPTLSLASDSGFPSNNQITSFKQWQIMLRTLNTLHHYTVY